MAGFQTAHGSVLDTDKIVTETALAAKGHHTPLALYNYVVAKLTANARAIAAALGLPYRLHRSGVISTRTSANAAGDATFEALRSITIPGNGMGLNGALRVQFHFEGSGTVTKTLAVKLGGTTLFTVNISGTSINYGAIIDIVNQNSLSSQVASKAGASTTATLTASINTASDATLEIGANWSGATAGSETISLRTSAVWIEYQA